MKGRIWEGNCIYLKCSDGMIEGRFVFPCPADAQILGALIGRLAEGIEVITCSEEENGD